MGCVLFSLPNDSHAASLQNADFETGDLGGWQTQASGLSIQASTNESFNRYYAARISGSYAGDTWITNSISQKIAISAGDKISALGFVHWKTQADTSPDAESYIEAALEGPIVGSSRRWDNPTNGWLFFDLDGELFGVADGGFESGTLDSWTMGNDHLVATINRTTVDEGNYSLKMAGSWNTGWSFNQGFQVFQLKAGDVVTGSARINVVDLTADGGWAVAGIKLENELNPFYREAVVRANASNTGWTNLEFTAVITNDGYYVFRCMVCGNGGSQPTTAEVYFDDVRLWREPVTVDDGGFELGTNTFFYWGTGVDHLAVGVATNIRDSGEYALHMAGVWTGWSFNQAYQVVNVSSGDTVHARGRMYMDDLDTVAGWLVSGIKLESSDGLSAFEHVFDQHGAEDSWLDLSFDARITNSGEYVFRAMTCGNSIAGTVTGVVVADVYFDGIQLWRDGDATGDVVDVTLRLSYAGFSGGASSQSTAEVYFDSAAVEGSTANLQPATQVYEDMRAAAAAVAADPSETDVPTVLYPKINSYGYPGGDSAVTTFAAHVEASVAGWRFRRLTNNVVLTLTNTVLTYGLGAAGAGFMEFDQYLYCDRFWGTERGAALDIDTNAPYFTLGTLDESSAEFGEGPFEATHTYVVGTPLSNFPKRLVTSYDGQYPTALQVVFDENLSTYDRSRDKYFVVSTVATNGPACNVKAVKILLTCDDAGNTNLAFTTQEIHMGWGDETACQGMVDYPNCTYQDHNEVFLRAGWLYGLLDKAGWFMQQVPRGSATIEPLDLYSMKSGNWEPKVYEEYLFSWPNAASGVRSIFDEDTVDRIPGPASYHVGFKVGHQYGTNEFGEPQFPQVIEFRGNGYFRMTDYGGVMGGSFRPVSHDVFGLFLFKEDAPIMPTAYTRLIARTTPTNEPDDSYGQMFMPVYSKTNNWFAGAVKVDTHFAPGEVQDTGAYFELESDVYANKAVVRSEHGKLNAFAQVDMYWRGGPQINDYTEGHDFDAIMVKKADGEWITHHPVNPPTNIYHRELCAFQSNDVAYLMQQDRGPYSYGFSTEAPYRKVSSFEITMLDDGGRDLSLEMYEQNTISEINDNVVIACAINEDLAKGDAARTRYRYRGMYAPGVHIVSPNTPDGGENWSNNTYTIEFIATDGEDLPLQANLYYGNGRDDGWTLINEGELIMVPVSEHRYAYTWNVASVPPGAYYIKVDAQRTTGGKTGFDVSDNRLQVGGTFGFPNNGATNVTVVTNAFGYLGTNMSFETGDVIGWASQGDDLDIYAASVRAYEGVYSARMRGTGWTNWSWNNLQQEIPCVSGEVLHVTGRVFIGSLKKGSTNWVRCGVKMEGTNAAPSSEGAEFNETTPTGTWLNVDFTRTAPADGTDRLLLWVAGYNCSGADVFFDDLRVTSTNTGLVVTNRVRAGYWEGDTTVDVTAHDNLSFLVSSPSADQAAGVWVADASGVTNRLALSNYLGRIVSLPQMANVPWTDFGTIDRAHVRSVGFDGAVSASSVRSVESPVAVSIGFPAAPLVDLQGLPHYNPGQDVIEIITISNRSGSALSDVNIQLLQEYGEQMEWLDSAHTPHLPSAYTRKGDRLCGTVERVWQAVTIPAGGSITLTNVYGMPAGRLIDHTKFAMNSGEDWYIFRNYASRAQLHVVIREADGDNVYDTDQAASYSMDDDFDIDDDGLPDAWEIQHGGSYTILDPWEDSDGDTYDNLSEYLGGSDPNDPDSYPGHVTEYTLHLAYTNGVDGFPRATAEQSNYTGAACGWMIARYLNGESFTQSQTQIYLANTTDPEHNGEITPASIAYWMYRNVDPGYYFSARYRTNLTDALKESVYWMDYLPPGGLKTPVYIACGTNWSYQVVRGFQTDRPPYDGGYGVTTNAVYTIYGLWLNDPRMSGMGYDVYAAASEMESIYEPSTSDGRYWLVAEPPEDEAAQAAAAAAIDGSTVTLAEPAASPEFAAFFTSLFGVPTGPVKMDAGVVEPDLRTILPGALKDDEGFMGLFDQASATNYYVVNPAHADARYVLGAGGLRGPASSVYVIKLNATNGAFQQATWNAASSLYPPVSRDAAIWVGLQDPAFEGIQSESGNLLLNGSFETNGASATTADRWSSDAAAVREAWGQHSGSYSMAMEGWVGQAYGYFYQDTAGSADTEYTFSIWLEKDAAFSATSVELKLEWFGAGMTPLGQATTNVLSRLGSSHQEFSLASRSPSGTVVVRCTLWVGGISYSEAALKCDDASLTQMSDGPTLVSATLVYDPDRDASPFLPRWELMFDAAGDIVTNQVLQGHPLDADGDFDGMSDRKELYAGTDPDDAGSMLEIGGQAVAGSPDGEVDILWRSVSNRYYSLSRSTNLMAGFQILQKHIQANPTQNTFTDRLPGPTTFYKLEVE